jgi:hypothetical protein
MLQTHWVSERLTVYVLGFTSWHHAPKCWFCNPTTCSNVLYSCSREPTLLWSSESIHATQLYFCGSIGKVTLHNLCNPKGLCVESELGYFFMQVYSEEWSFGYCEFGTGVFCCTPTMNPMYTHRESIVLGHILLSRRRIGQILSELSREWNGSSYDPLSRNCNHFCDALCERLGVPKLPCKAFLILILVLYLSSWVACQGKLEVKAKK